MIITLTGPTGAGKTDTSWALLELAPPMVFLDCDWFASRVPFSWDEEPDVESVYQALSMMIEHHMGRGSNRFVIPLTLEMAQSYAQHRRHFDRFGLPLFSLFRLACEADVLRKRVTTRDRSPEKRLQELEVIPLQLRISRMLPDMFVTVDVSAMDDLTVARTILTVIDEGCESA